MRVLYFAERFWPYIGGIEVISARLLPELARRGVELAVVTSNERDGLPARDSFEGIELWRFPMIEALRDNDLDAIADISARLVALRRDFRPDLVHAVFAGPTYFFVAVTAHAHPAPSVLAVHGSWPLPMRRQNTLLRRAIDGSDWFTGCSRSALADLAELDPSIEPRSQTIYYGLAPGPEPRPLRVDPPLLLCAARLVADKGIDVAVEALPAVRARFPDARLLVAGDGPARAELVPRSAELGLEDAVEFLGWRSPEEMAALIERVSLVLVPSRLEGFGIVALEAMRGARPVVASRVGGLPEVLGGEGGLLVEPDSPAQLAESVCALLAEPQRMRALGAAGRARALAEFPVERFVSAHEALYARLVSAHAA